MNEVHNYSKDGPMCYRHIGNQPVYAPNSYGGPRADAERYRDPSWFVEAGEIMRTAYVAHKDDNDFIQAGTLYRQVMSPIERDHLVGNIVWNLRQGGGALHPGARGEKLLVPGRPRSGGAGSQRPWFKPMTWQCNA